MDLKFDLLKHPNIALAADGRGKSYIHGEAINARDSIYLDDISLESIKELGLPSKQYELLSEEDLENLIETQEEDE